MLPEFQAARIFIHWIETDFHTYCEKIADFDVLEVLEQAHLSLLEDTHIWSLQRRMHQIAESMGTTPARGSSQPETIGLSSATT